MNATLYHADFANRKRPEGQNCGAMESLAAAELPIE